MVYQGVPGCLRHGAGKAAPYSSSRPSMLVDKGLTTGAREGRALRKGSSTDVREGGRSRRILTVALPQGLAHTAVYQLTRVQPCKQQPVPTSSAIYKLLKSEFLGSGKTPAASRDPSQQKAREAWVQSCSPSHSWGKEVWETMMRGQGCYLDD